MKRFIRTIRVPRALPAGLFLSCAFVTGCGKPDTGEMLRLIPFLSMTIFAVSCAAVRLRGLHLVYAVSLALFSVAFWCSLVFELFSNNDLFMYLLVIQSFIVYAWIAHGLGARAIGKILPRNAVSFIVPCAVAVMVTVFFAATVILNADGNDEIGDLTVWLFGSPLLVMMALSG